MSFTIIINKTDILLLLRGEKYVELVNGYG